MTTHTVVPAGGVAGGHAAAEHTSAALAELFGMVRSTVYRVVQRAASA